MLINGHTFVYIDIVKDFIVFNLVSDSATISDFNADNARSFFSSSTCFCELLILQHKVKLAFCFQFSNQILSSEKCCRSKRRQ